MSVRQWLANLIGPPEGRGHVIHAKPKPVPDRDEG